MHSLLFFLHVLSIHCSALLSSSKASRGKLEPTYNQNKVSTVAEHTSKHEV
jgi:hypothetical protein